MVVVIILAFYAAYACSKLLIHLYSRTYESKLFTPEIEFLSDIFNQQLAFPV